MKSKIQIEQRRDELMAMVVNLEGANGVFDVTEAKHQIKALKWVLEE